MKIVKGAVFGFFLSLVIVAISTMYKSSKAEMGRQGQQAQAAQQTRPHDLQLLKRSAVRAACTDHPDWDMETCQTIDQKEVSIGMTSEQVRLSWGKPERINTTTTANIEREQWVYGREYLYVVNGVLRSMQTSSEKVDARQKKE
jgi:hypothetical protein